MSEYCKGCGIQLQNENPEELGFVPSLDAQYCQRCFRIRNYGDVVIHMADGIESAKTLEKINELDGTVFWIADLFDLESSLIDQLSAKLPGKKIVLILTKRDVLPKTLTDQKILEYIKGRLKEKKIDVENIVLAGHMLKDNEPSREVLDLLQEYVDYYGKEGNIIFMGMANAGKSTLINRLLKNEDLTISRYPGTTLDVVPIEQEGFTIYDTPGLEDPHSMLSSVPARILKTIVPQKPIKPFVSQIFEEQSFAVGGLARLDVVASGKATVVGYFSLSLPIHRGKKKDADALWAKHLGGMLSPAIDTSLLTMHTYKAPKLKKNQKMDIVIHGLGWFTVSGAIDEIYVRVHKGIHVTFRKAMI